MSCPTSTVGAEPLEVAIDAVRGAYVTHREADSVSVIDTRSNTTIGSPIEAVADSPV